MTTYIFLSTAYGVLAAYHACQLHRSEDDLRRARVRENLHHDLMSGLIYAFALALHPFP